jgi:hypothetical protein
MRTALLLPLIRLFAASASKVAATIAPSHPATIRLRFKVPSACPKVQSTNTTKLLAGQFCVNHLVPGLLMRSTMRAVSWKWPNVRRGRRKRPIKAEELKVTRRPEQTSGITARAAAPAKQA